MIGFVPFDHVGQSVQEHAAFVGREPRPAGGVESPLGGLDGPIHVVRLHGGHIGQRLARARIASAKHLAVGGQDVFAADHCRQRTFAEKRGDLGQNSGRQLRVHGQHLR